MAEVEMDHLVKRFPNGRYVVADLSLTVADGEFVALLGPSGSGKSAVLEMVAGLEDITRGELRFDGEVVTETPPWERDVAVVFQSPALYPHLTVAQNIAFPLRLAGTGRTESATLVRETADLLGISAHLDRLPGTLAAGQRQRVAIGKTLVRHPKVLLMDEPVANLDVRLRGQMRSLIGDLHTKFCTTTIYVTQDHTEAMALSDRVVVLRDGVVQQVGTPTELDTRPLNLFVAELVGDAAMNLLPATLEGESVVSGLGTFALPPAVRRASERSPGNEVVLGIRPGDLELVGSDEDEALVVSVQLDDVVSVGSQTTLHFTVPNRGAPSPRSLPPGFSVPVAGTAATARISGPCSERAGSRVRLRVDLARLQIFDSGSGLNLSAPP
ncbi:MAG: ABC transporter ATP-binding protein [Marmoricola sp.]